MSLSNLFSVFSRSPQSRLKKELRNVDFKTAAAYFKDNKEPMVLPEQFARLLHAFLDSPSEGTAIALIEFDPKFAEVLMAFKQHSHDTGPEKYFAQAMSGTNGSTPNRLNGHHVKLVTAMTAFLKSFDEETKSDSVEMMVMVCLSRGYHCACVASNKAAPTDEQLQDMLELFAAEKIRVPSDSPAQVVLRVLCLLWRLPELSCEEEKVILRNASRDFVSKHGIKSQLEWLFGDSRF